MSNSSPSSLIPTMDNFKKSLYDLPKARFWEAMDIYQWEGFWLEASLMKPAMIFRSNFQARDDDVLLASTMKTGTTWLKSLSLCIMHRNNYLKGIPEYYSDHHHRHHKHDDILTKENPHFHVPTIESTMYSTKTLKVDLYDASAPRLMHTHLPYAVLPDSIKNSSCKIVYIARNPKDTLISMWHFFNSILRQNQEAFPLEKAVDCFCSGAHQYGPFFEHVVGYWQESQKRPEKVLFLKYEEMKSDPKRQVTKIAEFLGRPFGDEGEGDDVLWRCSLERLKNLEVNKSGSILLNVPNSCYFRKGEVGDWKNYLTPQMENQINQTSLNKFEPFGLFL